MTSGAALTDKQIPGSQRFIDVQDVICTAESNTASVRLIGACPLFNSDSDSEEEINEVKDSGSFKDGDLILGAQVIGSIRSDRYGQLRNEHMRVSKYERRGLREQREIDIHRNVCMKSAYASQGADQAYATKLSGLPDDHAFRENVNDSSRLVRENVNIESSVRSEYATIDPQKTSSIKGESPTVNANDGGVCVDTGGDTGRDRGGDTVAAGVTVVGENLTCYKTVFFNSFDDGHSVPDGQTDELKGGGSEKIEDEGRGFKGEVIFKSGSVDIESCSQQENIENNTIVPLTLTGKVSNMPLNIPVNCEASYHETEASNSLNEFDATTAESPYIESLDNNKASSVEELYNDSTIVTSNKLQKDNNIIPTDDVVPNPVSSKQSFTDRPGDEGITHKVRDHITSNMNGDGASAVTHDRSSCTDVEYDSPFVGDSNHFSVHSGSSGSENFMRQDSNKTIVSPGEDCVDIGVNDQTKAEENRFNPFDREVVFTEEHFSSSEEYAAQQKQDENKSSSGSSFSTLSLAELDTDVTNAELGLAEDYFSRPEGHFGMTGIEELEMAIDNCKELIHETQAHSEKHKSLVKKLVQLRLKVQELKEGDTVQETDVRTVVGHRFSRKESRSSKHYCEKCNSLIWGMLQIWYRCKDCGYCSHDKCLNLITRTCASVKVHENPTYILNICPERGLAAQGYRCAECRLPIGNMSQGREPRLCDYTGNVYCDLCHWNNSMIIPARVTHNWDFEPRKVCRATKQLLRLMNERSVLRVCDINPMLFNFVDELNSVKKFREEFLLMKKYFLCCKKALDEKLLLQLRGRQHFVENSDIYSLKDLIDIHLETLLPELDGIHSAFKQHITQDCQLCRVKGFICEICNSSEILFPFDNISTVCPRCSYVLHRNCFLKGDNRCPRCERREKRGET